MAYGKAILGLQAFQKQIVNDIIPDLLTNTVPKLIDETPNLINSLSEKGPNQISSDLLKKSQDVLTSVRDISQDPSMLQSTIGMQLLEVYFLTVIVMIVMVVVVVVVAQTYRKT